MGTTITPSSLTDRDAKATAASPTWKKFHHAHLETAELSDPRQSVCEPRCQSPRLPHCADSASQIECHHQTRKTEDLRRIHFPSPSFFRTSTNSRSVRKLSKLGSLLIWNARSVGIFSNARFR